MLYPFTYAIYFSRRRREKALFDFYTAICWATMFHLPIYMQSNSLSWELSWKSVLVGHTGYNIYSWIQTAVSVLWKPSIIACTWLLSSTSSMIKSQDCCQCLAHMMRNGVCRCLRTCQKYTFTFNFWSALLMELNQVETISLSLCFLSLLFPSPWCFSSSR